MIYSIYFIITNVNQILPVMCTCVVFKILEHYTQPLYWIVYGYPTNPVIVWSSSYQYASIFFGIIIYLTNEPILNDFDTNICERMVVEKHVKSYNFWHLLKKLWILSLVQLPFPQTKQQDECTMRFLQSIRLGPIQPKILHLWNTLKLGTPRLTQGWSPQLSENFQCWSILVILDPPTSKLCHKVCKYISIQNCIQHDKYIIWPIYCRQHLILTHIRTNQSLSSWFQLAIHVLNLPFTKIIS